jgi:hypothetical protein
MVKKEILQMRDELIVGEEGGHDLGGEGTKGIIVGSKQCEGTVGVQRVDEPGTDNGSRESGKVGVADNKVNNGCPLQVSDILVEVVRWRNWLVL